MVTNFLMIKSTFFNLTELFWIFFFNGFYYSIAIHVTSRKIYETNVGKHKIAALVVIFYYLYIFSHIVFILVFPVYPLISAKICCLCHDKFLRYYCANGSLTFNKCHYEIVMQGLTVNLRINDFFNTNWDKMEVRQPGAWLI